MSFADLFAALGYHNPYVPWRVPVSCPACGQPTNGIYDTWLQPCGHIVDEAWLRATLAINPANERPAPS